ncbi:hypothetical protein M3Y94_01059500 [Aphelenchoides besseyi]|nr:hypothetical protein M3Y94_01059500 [Aphelenchoides besseyi]KAI6224169.1 hypothetical protein M3Y95_00854600 [Aphelenchoides besseyi]
MESSLIVNSTSFDMFSFVSRFGDYLCYEIFMTSLALVINGFSFITVGPRSDDYSGFVIILSSAMDIICACLHLFSRIGDHPTGEFQLIDNSFFDTILETHFTLLFLPVTLKLLLMIIHIFMQALYWFDTLRPQKFDHTTDLDEVFQAQLWIDIKLKLSLILLLQAAYPALLIGFSIFVGSQFALNPLNVGLVFNWLAPLVPVTSAFTLLLAVPVVRAAFSFPFRCRKQITPGTVEPIVPVHSYSLPI